MAGRPRRRPCPPRCPQQFPSPRRLGREPVLALADRPPDLAPATKAEPRSRAANRRRPHPPRQPTPRRQRRGPPPPRRDRHRGRPPPPPPPPPRGPPPPPPPPPPRPPRGRPPPPPQAAPRTLAPPSSGLRLAEAAPGRQARNQGPAPEQAPDAL